ncbi:MAG: hypothetical protein ACRCY6_04625, partial [Bacteroidales bacterium]
MEYKLQNPNCPRIKSIIFDLGGVLIDIDYQRTINAFMKLGVKDAAELYTQFAQVPLFDELETGRITPEEFRLRLRALTQCSASDAEIDEA